MMVITTRPDASPNSGVVRNARPGPLPGVAPAGIEVWKVATPLASVVPCPVMRGTPGIESVNVMSRPGRTLPSGSVATARSSRIRGSLAALIR